MKTPYYNFLFLFVFPVLFFSCSDIIEDTYVVNEPVYMTYEELRSSVKSGKSIEMSCPGKVYIKDNYIFINEYQKGIQIIDNTNPAFPEAILFINIPGNVDMAVKENILYADNYVDLVAIDIGEINHIQEVARIENVFGYAIPEYGTGIIEEIDETKGVVIGWKKKKKPVDDSHEKIIYPDDIDYFLVPSYSGFTNGSLNNTGVGGSMACFTIYEDYLYTIEQSIMHLFSLSTTAEPVSIKNIWIGGGIETLFPYQNALFIGSKTGMYIYSLEDPENPVFMSMFSHVTACDPVVADSHYAYVTLRDGNKCGNSVNRLYIIKIENINSPVFIKEYEMFNPYGLGIDNNILFVCDGNAGLKIFDASDPYNIENHLLKVYPDINAFDVIPLHNTLITIAETGLFQYDYSNPQNISLISSLYF